MPYTPTTWVEGVTTLGPTNMNKIEAELAFLDGGGGDHGAELAYTEFNADVSIIVTSAATAATVVTAAAVTFDGSTAVWVEFQATRVEAPTTAGVPIILDLWDGSTDLGIIGSVVGAASSAAPFNRSRRITPSAASHTFSVRGWVPSGTGAVVRAGAGGAGTNLPGHIRIVRV
jgi:hypothetical protein